MSMKLSMLKCMQDLFYSNIVRHTNTKMGCPDGKIYTVRSLGTVMRAITAVFRTSLGNPGTKVFIMVFLRMNGHGR